MPYWTITVDRLVTTAVLGGQLPQEPVFQDFPNGFVFRGLWAIGRACWHDDPQKRPSASYVSNELAIFMNYLEENPKGMSTFKYLCLDFVTADNKKKLQVCQEGTTSTDS